MVEHCIEWVYCPVGVLDMTSYRFITLRFTLDTQCFVLHTITICILFLDYYMSR